MKQNGDIYECYSSKQYGFLTMKGFKPCGDFIHNKTKVKCYQYVMTDELSAALKEWHKLRP